MLGEMRLSSTSRKSAGGQRECPSPARTTASRCVSTLLFKAQLSVPVQRGLKLRWARCRPARSAPTRLHSAAKGGLIKSFHARVKAHYGGVVLSTSPCPPWVETDWTRRGATSARCTSAWEKDGSLTETMIRELNKLLSVVLEESGISKEELKRGLGKIHVTTGEGVLDPRYAGSQ